MEHVENINAFDQLLKFNIKPSVQRIAIMDYLIKNRTHPAIDEIYIALYPSIPTLSKTTVYNTLKLFNEHGAVQTLTIDERNTCFDIDTSSHGHFLCKKCAKISDFVYKSSTKELRRLRDEGYRVDESHYYYKGLCKECSDIT